jgi:hypothetical protein
LLRSGLLWAPADLEDLRPFRLNRELQRKRDTSRAEELVIDVTHSIPASDRDAVLDAFLFAPVGDEKSGMSLSVLSALARLDLDPWQEASALTRLPKNVALDRLNQLLAALPGGTLAAQPNTATIAARLVALLPSRIDSVTPSREALRGVGAPINAQTVIRAILINAVVMAVLLGSQLLAINHPMPIHGGPMTASHTESAESSQQSSGR